MHILVFEQVAALARIAQCLKAHEEHHEQCNCTKKVCQLGPDQAAFCLPVENYLQLICCVEQCLALCADASCCCLNGDEFVRIFDYRTDIVTDPAKQQCDLLQLGVECVAL